uniref:Sm domain-containing protein n=1 Tax=Mucochytrium quahogii TaxID=96639 RepID=A0A7S2RGP2_9STRA|mmetsp:Transcript_11985/g.19513  ORF Transcript_11985/g.19513 Transcript_11985/m.19513 type:complete len:140 (+) Transcript_11985:127-546(+)
MSSEDEDEDEEGRPGRKVQRKDGWRSLCSLLECMEGDVITVELKNDLVVSGYLDGVDNGMNLVLGKAHQYWMEGKNKGRHGPNMEVALISGKRIRYIHFPDKLDMEGELRSWHKRKNKAKFKRNYIVDRPKLSSSSSSA